MSELGEMFKFMDELKKERRASNTEKSTSILIEKAINFESKNGGAHLIVKHGGKVIDYWPSTGLWVDRKTMKRKGGVFQLIKYLERAE